jgi:hypothetical protein
MELTWAGRRQCRMLKMSADERKLEKGRQGESLLALRLVSHEMFLWTDFFFFCKEMQFIEIF